MEEQEELTMPISVDLSRISIFTHVREVLNQMKMDYNAEFRFVFYTSLGRIECDIEPPEDKGSLIRFDDNPDKIDMDISAILDGKEVFNVQLLNAKNLVIYENSTGRELSRLDQMALFVDQIIGFTLVKKAK